MSWITIENMKKNILITAVGGRSVGSGILHALTRVSEEVNSRWNIFAADAESFAWGLYKVDNRLLLPLASDVNYISKIIEVINEYNIHAIIPGSEAETSILSQERDRVKVPIIANNSSLMPLMMDKFSTMLKLKELGLPTIPTFNVDEFEKAILNFNYPYIIKPTTGTGGSKGVVVCTNRLELDNALSRLPSNSNYCIQPIIGTDEDEYTVGVLSDIDGNIIDSIVLKRKLVGLSLLDTKKINNIKYSVSTGYSQGYFVKHKKIQSFCEDLAKKIGSIGPLNIQLRIHEGEIFVFEIHPRFSGTSTMRADVGFNEPDILLRNILYKEKFTRINYMTDVAVIRAFEHVVVPIQDMI